MGAYTLTFSQRNVLIIDDAQAVISVVRSMLRAMGFSDNCIDYAKEGKSALNCIKLKKYDVIICDYNLGDGLNGRQLLDEIRHGKLLGPDSVFIMITGESSKTIVRSIIELRPDDYILKPFNQQQLQRRLRVALSKRSQYRALYEIDHQHDAAAGIALCNELLCNESVDQLLVNQFKGQFLQSLRKYDEAQNLYWELDKKHADAWIKIELCNVLVELGDYDEVESIMAHMSNDISVSSLPELTVMSKLEIYKDNIPEAISHLTLASSLAPGNPDRELVIANLCLSESDYTNAERRYSIYRACCKGTFRDDLTSSINVVRGMLLSIEEEDYNAARDNDLRKIESFIFTLYSAASSADEKVSVEILYIHSRILRGELGKAMLLFYKVMSVVANIDFYSRYHLCRICSLLMFDARYKENFQIASEMSLKMDNLLVSKSCMIMLHSLDMNHACQKRLYQEKYDASLLHRVQHPQKELAALIQLHQMNPYLQQVAIRIIELLGMIWPRMLNKMEVLSLIESCDNTVSTIMSLSQQQHNNYQGTLSAAKQHTENKRA
ncbi:response regulator [Aeromonas veronii]|uniref:response regulator n=1 Tax=Aeromonas veronii TaxID=654 RepID=UPI0032EE036F